MSLKNLTTPLGQNLVVSGGNLVLAPVAVARAMRGTAGVLNTTTASHAGAYRVSVYADKNLTIGGVNLRWPSGNNAVLAANVIARTVRGTASVLNAQDASARGAARVLNSVTRADRGYARIAWQTFSNVRQRGLYNVFMTTGQYRVGYAAVYRGTTTKQRGTAHIFESYLPIIRCGSARVFNSYTPIAHRGRSRIANDAIAGYVAYVGLGGMPDFGTGPDGFSAALPVAFAVTPPVTGTLDLYVVLREQSAYGLESQNQQAQIITIDTNGDEVLGQVTAPTDIEVTEAENEYFLVFAYYPGYGNDRNPATHWRVYVGEGAAPVPGVDTPAATEGIGDTIGALVGPYPNGATTYHIAVTVYRETDGLESEAVEAELVLGADPLTPVSVGGGFEDRD